MPSSRSLLAHAQQLLCARRLDEAWSAYEQAEAAGANPDDCSAGRWTLAMLRGDFEAAWSESDAIRARGGDDPHRFWQGEDLAGKSVMLRCLHGYGDTVQMMRYAPAIRAGAKKLIVEVAPPMVELTQLFTGVETVITWGERAPKISPEWDVQIEINELPYIFRTQAGDLPLLTRYLNLPQTSTQRVSTRCPGVLAVGVVWAGGDWNPSRSIPLPLLQPLLATAGVEFWNLQGGAARAQWELFADQTNLHPAPECAGSILHLAGLIAQLDLVITTDTLAAHLAGALATPAWLLLQQAADHRWQHLRNDSPWYPSLRLFRQQQAEDWSGVLSVVETSLRDLANTHVSRGRVA